LHIVKDVWSDYFWKRYCPFSMEIFHQ
jgi:hypothetical protein